MPEGGGFRAAEFGEGSTEQGANGGTLALRLSHLFAGCEPEQVARMVVVYEPEWTIGVQEPASPSTVGTGCAFIRQWIGHEYGIGTAEAVRIIYGGSVAPEYAKELLALPEVDGLGASRKGRIPTDFAKIVRLIALAK